MTTFTIKFESYDKVLLGNEVITFQIREARENQFCWHHQSYNHVDKTTYKDESAKWRALQALLASRARMLHELNVLICLVCLIKWWAAGRA